MKMKMLNKNRLQLMALIRSLGHSAESWAVSGKHRFFGKRLRPHLRCGEEGGALVEFVLVAPLMLTLITGMFSVVMALMNYQELGSATNAAGMVLITARGNLSDPCATVASTVSGALPTWTSTKFTYTVTITNAAGTLNTYGPTTPTGGSPFTCTAGAAELASSEPATVSVSYQYTWIPAYLLKLAGNLAATTSVLVN